MVDSGRVALGNARLLTERVRPMTGVRRFFVPRFVWVGLVMASWFFDGNVAFSQVKQPRDPQIEKTLNDLESTEFQRWQAAIRALVDGGEDAIDALEEAAGSADLEVATRCVEALVLIADDDRELPRIFAVLNRLAADPTNAIANLAELHAAKLDTPDEDRALKALRSEGLRVHQSSDGRVYSVDVSHDRHIFWLKHFKKIRSVDIRGGGVTDAGIATLIEMPHLEDLDIRQSSVTDAALATLRHLKGLERIRISAEEFSPDALRSLGAIPTLKRLSLSSTTGEEAIVALADLEQLETLYLSELKVSARAIESLNQLKKLHRVSFSVTEINDQQLKWLGQIAIPTDLSVSRSPALTVDAWRHLREARLLGLSIFGCGIENASLRHIGEIPMLETLSINDAKISDEGLVHLENLKALTTLHLNQVQVTNKGAEKLEKVLPSLRHVSVRNAGGLFPLPAMPVRSRINFRKDSVSDEQNAFVHQSLTAEDISLLKKEQNLGTVFLTVGDVKDSDLMLLADVPMKGVVINSKHVTDRGIESLADHSTLESVGLWSSSISDKSLKSVARIPSLTKITIQNAEITNEGMAGLIEELDKAGKIKWLSLFRCPQVTDQGLKGIERLQSLEHLTLNNCEGLTSGILDDISKLPKLNRLEIDDLMLDESDLAGLATLTKLETLGVSSGKPEGTLTNQGLTLLAKITSLKSLTIQNAQIDDRGVTELVKLKEMEQLGLTGTGISDAGVAALADAMPHLTRLNLERTSVTDSAMNHVGKLTKLEWLTLEETEVGDEGLKMLDALAELQHISIEHDNVTSEGHKRFRSKHPSTRIYLH